MGLFKQRRPRGFQHQYLYADERKDVLKDVEERAKRSLVWQTTKASQAMKTA